VSAESPALGSEATKEGTTVMHSLFKGLVIAAVPWLAAVSANAQYQISVIPDQPGPGQAFQIEVQGSTSHSPATVSDPILQIDGSTIFLQVSVEMGPWATPDTYTHVFDIPPQALGTYTVEFWESRLYDPDPTPTLVDSVLLQLQGHPVPALSIVGVAILLLLTVVVAVRALGR
jgi:hypothetical protein